MPTKSAPFSTAKAQSSTEVTPHTFTSVGLAAEAVVKARAGRAAVALARNARELAPRRGERTTRAVVEADIADILNEGLDLV
jgi:hypothetical protein